MSRRRQAVKREITPDGRFNSQLVGRLINTVMKCGKKSVAQRIVYGAFNSLGEKVPDASPVDVLQRAVDNAKPRLEVKPRRVGGANYQVPREVRPERRLALGLRWIVEAAEGTKGKPMAESLLNEIKAAHKGEGSAVQKKETTHRMAEANKAFAHFAW